MARTIIDQIIGGIADMKGIDPVDLDITLQRYVSVDAIQDLAKHENDSWRLQFETPDHIVEVTGNNKILVDGTQMRTLS